MGEDRMSDSKATVVSKSLRDIIGCGYDEWFYNLDNSKEVYRDGMTRSQWAKSVRYWVVKGGRG